jgi:ADP-ribose pyrophosphatase YjhB (NUDIX family)
MSMTTDIYSDKAVDLVIFTVADQAEVASRLWDASLLSTGKTEKQTPGLSLYVVTVPIDPNRYPNSPQQRVLPGGYLGKTETIQQASQRILMERLGLSLRSKIRQLGTFDEPTRDPNGRVLSFAYWGMVNFEDIRRYLGGKEQIGLELVNSHDEMNKYETKTRRLDEYDGVCRFGHRLMPNVRTGVGHTKTLTKDLPSGRILGLDHDEMVFYAWRALRHAFGGRLDPFRYLGINPLGEAFRLSDLQEFTEVCRGERIQRDLFRRQMQNTDSFIKPTASTDKSRPGKPAILYSLQPEVEKDIATEKDR